MAAGTLAGPHAVQAQCRDYAIRRVYTAPVVVTYPTPAYPVLTYPVYTEPVYTEPVYVAPVVNTYTRCYRPAVSVYVNRDYGYRRCYSGSRHHRGWSASFRYDSGRHGHGYGFSVRRHRY